MVQRNNAEEEEEKALEEKVAKTLDTKSNFYKDHFQETIEEQRRAFFTDIRDEPYKGVVRVKKHVDVLEKVHDEHDKVQKAKRVGR